MNGPSAKRVFAAVDNSLAANPVLVTARALARAFDARVEAIYVRSNEDQAPAEAAAAVGVPLRVVSGAVVDQLSEAAADPDTAALVIGGRSSPRSPHALGSTALAVVTSCSRPVVVVPLGGRTAPILRKVLVPLEGTASTALAPRSIVELGRNANIEVVALHVDEDGSAPDDDEFLRRFCPWGIGFVTLERRSGRREDLIPAVADELGCDVIALGWSQELAPGRAEVVRATLERSPLPVMLIPANVETTQKPLDSTVGGAER
jgi:nucleotide-binding universal stress UspA family protein